MEGNPLAYFEEQFRRVYGGVAEPYHWQRELFGRFLRGDVPRLIDLPTGTGKTSVMLIWYAALSWMLQKGEPILLPRRLVWVVNRRVVVDQATTEAEKLQSLDILPEKLAVSTLRGQLADNGDWKRNPSRPAIIIGTVDMIGSRLMFCGYGDGPYWRPHHAGLLGVDALFINDEAHLTPAFAKLVRAVEKLQPASKLFGKQFRFCELSATPTRSDEATPFPGGLGADLRTASEFYKRCTAEKRLYLHQEPDKKRAALRFLELAKEASAPRTIVFRESPEAARDLAEQLELTNKGCVELLTGTMRGRERDLLVDRPVFKSFLQGSDVPTQPVWLVATSAGEVGVDISAERQVSMLVEADHLIQRFGRLNRFGGERGDAHVVCSPPSDKEPEKQSTLRWLENLPSRDGAKDIRALTIYENRVPREANTPPPKMAELDGWLIDLWSQTTGKGSYPKVSYWLHGKQEAIPETSIAWRIEVDELVAAHEAGYVTTSELEEAFQAFPMLPREKLTEPSSRVKEKLKALSEIRPDTKVLLRGSRGSVESVSLEKLSHDNTDLDECTIVLPPEFGRLTRGMLVPEMEDEGFDPREKDVADLRDGSASSRWHFISSDEYEPRRNEMAVFTIKLFDESYENAAANYLIYCEARPATQEAGRKEYLLETHLREVEVKAAELACSLVPELEAVYGWAGKNHDEGKDREIWQHAMGRCPGKVVAKPFKIPAGKQLAGYRHELGSLAKLDADDIPPDHLDLALHLIAAHHGHARPHFHDRAHDIERMADSQAVIDDTPQRFARLTERWGHWGLAYLESIFKSADGFVSGLADARYQVEGQVEDEGA